MPAGPTADKAHSMFGGSSMARVIACPGSALLCRDIPEPPSSEYAADGTKVHEWAANVLASRMDSCEHYAGFQLPSGAIFSKHDVRYLDEYIKLCASRYDAGPYYVETRFDLTDIDAEMYGTVDFGVYDEATRTAEIYDLKWGAGKRVYAANNPQLRTYACGFLRLLSDRRVERVKLHIVQPRIDTDTPVQCEEMTALDLFMWQETVLRPAVKAARATGARFETGEHCYWCRGKLLCPKMQEKRRAQAVIGFEPERARAITDPGEMKTLCDDASLIGMWVEAVKEHCKTQAIAGNPPTGYEVRHRPGRRVWADEIAAENAMQRMGVNPFDLVSPAEAERRVGKGAFEELDAAHNLTARGEPTVTLVKSKS